MINKITVNENTKTIAKVVAVRFVLPMAAVVVTKVIMDKIEKKMDSSD